MLEPGDDARVREIISGTAEGALEVHDVRSRLAGRAVFIEFHMVVPSAMSVGDAHVICDRLEDSLRAEFAGAHVHIHVEPEDEAKAKGIPVL